MVEQSVTAAVWDQCAQSLQQELSAQQFNTWIKPLLVEDSLSDFCLVAPNRFIQDWVKEKFLHRIQELVNFYFTGAAMSPPSRVELKVGSRAVTQFTAQAPVQASSAHAVPMTSEPQVEAAVARVATNPNWYGGNTQVASKHAHTQAQGHVQASAPLSEVVPFEVPAPPPIVHKGPISTPEKTSVDIEGGLSHRSGLNRAFTFESFVEGKSNQLGLAAAQQVSENPGGSYNPLFIYGGVGLGKTHLMHAVGNALLDRNPNAKIVYLHSERFVADMVKALQLNAINDFKRYYRSVDALLIDDIQFFAGKDRSQEEFFHTFNALLEGNQQIILTCDRYPKVISNVEERLKSRFGWGLTVEIEPPELETRVAILMKRAEKMAIDLPYDAAFFVAQRIRSNVRELEGALKRVMANASFTQRPITVELVKEALKDLLALQDKQVSISNIQRVVGEYYKVKVAEFTSKRRSRSVARPRQMAMALAKELTNHSLPEIGEAFGGRDHTTVLHACRKIKELHDADSELQQDWKNLQRLLTT